MELHEARLMIIDEDTGRPRVDSDAYEALLCLHQDGAEADIDAWMKSVDYTSKAEFDYMVVLPLLSARLIRRSRAGVVLTKHGLNFLGKAAAVHVPGAVITPGKYVAPMRPLSDKYRARLRVMRPGALDYLDIPSRMGDLLIPHGAKAAA